jgi:hypothetical protein
MNYYGKPVDINGKGIKSISAWKKLNPRKLFFDSKFEWSCYMELKKAGFNFEFHPPAREVSPGFQSFSLSKGKSLKLFKSTVRPITYTTDFAVYCDNGKVVFIESKGFFHADARLRYKLFQATLKGDEISLMAQQKVQKGKAKDGADKDDLREIKAIIRIINEDFGGSNAVKEAKKKVSKITKL